MIVSACIVPHHAHLLHSSNPQVGQHIKKMIASCREKIQRHDDAIWCFVSAHASQLQNRISVAVHEPLRTSLKDYGILTQHTFAPAFSVISALQRAAHRNHAPFRAITTEEIDRGTSRAIELLQPPDNSRLVALGTSVSGVMEHARAGEYLNDVLQSISQPVVLVISGNGSHQHKTDSADGFSASAATMDAEVSHAIAHRSIAALVRAASIGFDEHECIIRPLALGLGALKGLATTRSRPTAYDEIEGVGLHASNLYEI